VPIGLLLWKQTAEELQIADCRLQIADLRAENASREDAKTRRKDFFNFLTLRRNARKTFQFSILLQSAFCIFALHLSVSQGWGALILQDTYNYSDATNASGQVFTGTVGGNITSVGNYSTGGTASDIKTYTAGLTYTGLETSNGKMTITNTINNANTVQALYAPVDPYTNAFAGTIYTSFLINVASRGAGMTTTTTSDLFSLCAATSLSPTIARWEGGLRLDSTDSTKLNFGFGYSTKTYDPFNTELALNVTHLIVIGLNFASGANYGADVWINPASLGGAAPAATFSVATGVYAAFMNGYKFYSDIDGAVATADVGYSIDEFRIGTTFADVTPAVPEPSTMVLLALGAGSFAARRRKNCRN